MCAGSRRIARPALVRVQVVAVRQQMFALSTPFGIEFARWPVCRTAEAARTSTSRPLHHTRWREVMAHRHEASDLECGSWIVHPPFRMTFWRVHEQAAPAVLRVGGHHAKRLVLRLTHNGQTRNGFDLEIEMKVPAARVDIQLAGEAVLVVPVVARDRVIPAAAAQALRKQVNRELVQSVAAHGMRRGILGTVFKINGDFSA